MKILATLSGLMAIVMWGALALLTQKVKGVPPYILLALCFFIAGLILPTIRLITTKPMHFRPQIGWRGGVISISCLMLFHVCYLLALDYAPVIQVSLISYLWPMLLALLVAKDGRRLRAFLGSVMGLIAVSLVLGWQHLSWMSAHLVGYVFALSCALIWAGYSFYISRTNNSINDMPWLCFGVSLLTFGVSYVTESWEFSLDGELIFFIILLALGPIGGAFYCWDIGLKHGNASMIAALSFGAPLISSLLLALFGYAQWSNNLGIALGLLIMASLIINHRK